MIAHEAHFVGHLIKSTVIGAAGGLVFAASLVTFDVAGIGTLLSTATSKALILALVLGGSATKGAAFGFAFSVAGSSRKQRVSRPAYAPVLATEAS